MSYIQIISDNKSFFGQISSSNQTSITCFVIDNGFIKKMVVKKDQEDTYVLLTEEEYQDIGQYKPTVEKEVNKGNNDSTFQKCVRLYKKMMEDNGGEHPVRKDAMDKFQEDFGISKNCAATYHQSIKTKIKNGDL